MKELFSLIFLSLVFSVSQQSHIVTVNAMDNVNITGIQYNHNFIGVVMDYLEIEHLINTTLFQKYFLNTNLNMQWSSNIFAQLRIPSTWYYNCPITVPPMQLPNGSSVPNPACERDLASPGDSFIEQVGNFVYNSQPQPFWTLGLSPYELNFFDTNVLYEFGDLFWDLHSSSGYYYAIEMGYEMNKYVERGFRSPDYTIQDFLDEFWYYDVMYYLADFKVPGLTEDAPEEWRAIHGSRFRSQFVYCIFTFESVIFLDPSEVTIENLLSPKSTTGYIERRKKINSTNDMDFKNYMSSFTNVKLMNGNGIDGITNSFAAGLWWIEFAIECAILPLYEMSIDGTMRENYYQSFWVYESGKYRPSVFYYASMFANYAGAQYPMITVPEITGGISNKIKAWAFENYETHKVVILNKDTNTSLSGKILYKVKSTRSSILGCFYFEAPSLESTDNFRIGGHYYIADNGNPQGEFKRFRYEYNEELKGYEIDIKYAQAALCEMEVSNEDIPYAECFEKHLNILAILGVLLLVIFVF